MRSFTALAVLVGVVAFAGCSPTDWKPAAEGNKSAAPAAHTTMKPIVPAVQQDTKTETKPDSGTPTTSTPATTPSSTTTLVVPPAETTTPPVAETSTPK